MAQTISIAHRWANQQFGKRDGTLTGSHTHCDEVSFYSYSTVIAQWFDKKRKIMGVIDLSLTKSTGRHVSAVRCAIPHDVTVFYLHRPGGYYEYANVDFCNWRGELDAMAVTKNFIRLLFDELKAVAKCNTLASGSFRWWSELQRWGTYFPEASVKKYLRAKLSDHKGMRAEQQAYRKMLRALLNGASYQEVVDVVNGEGTWQAYLDRTERIRKTAKKRERAEKIARYLGFYNIKDSGMTPNQLLALTPMERILIKFKQLNKSARDKRDEKRYQTQCNLLRFLGFQHIPSRYSLSRYFAGALTMNVVGDLDGKVIYDASKREDWSIPRIEFTNADLQKAMADPYGYRRKLQAKARILGKLHAGSHLVNKTDLTEYEQECLQAYQEFKAKHDSRYKTALARLAEERRRTEEEAKRKAAERELLIQSYKDRGIDGYRDLWREGFDRRPENNQFSDCDFFYGGNVLLRYVESKQIVETSKSVTLSVPQAKKMWRLIHIWHEHPEKFKRIEIPVIGTSYTAHSYKNDILTAGCHAIAYSEIERMAKQLHFI